MHPYYIEHSVTVLKDCQGTDVDDVLAEMLPTWIDPVTMFGAKFSGTGWNDVRAKSRTVASWFSDSTE